MDLDAEVPRGTKRKANENALPPEAPRRIKALDQDVVNKIAAGEIIVAPVHALKELTENAVDAGSTSIEVLVKDGGLKLLQITDNGHGINHDDMPILCERFTTSKLKAFEDLTSIGTYGFRGEALASISHIAHLQVTTKTEESSCAWKAQYSGGKLSPAKPGQSADPKACAGRQGTQITVEDLFYNVPTRRRAFRSASEEYAKILDLVGRYAVHCGNVAFSCKKHGDASMGISVAANASTVDRIRQIHGSAVTNELIQFEAANERWGFTSDGWISNANYHVKRLMLLLFINHRAVESSTIKKAIEQTYSTFLPKGGHPFIYLSLNIDPQRVDVNVHPTKREVNFLNEEEIIEIICDEIRARLGKVDTSRTFVTQSLLPGVKVPTISATSVNVITKSSTGTSELPSTATPIPKQSVQRTPASKPYENNLIRTDSKVRKITAMLPPASRSVSSHSLPMSDVNMVDRVGPHPVGDGDDMDYEQIAREPIVCRLATVKALRAEVRDSMHDGLTDIFTSHTFVGIVDERRRIAAIQSGVKLFLVDYGMLCNEYFYQIGLTDFGNFGSFKLDPPLPLRELLELAASSEQEKIAAAGQVDDLDWSEVVVAIENQLLARRDMLAEYFSFHISLDGELQSLPLLMKGYVPSLAKLPRFLLRLGPHVEWTDEQGCFHSFLRELASWYCPEQLPPPLTKQQQRTKPSNSTGSMSDLSSDLAEEPLEDESADLAARRVKLNRIVEKHSVSGFQGEIGRHTGDAKGGCGGCKSQGPV